jgi:hypothetical protein
MGIDFKVNFKTKIKINGKEYGSMDEVPEQYREKVRGALNSAGAAGHGKLVVNGTAYDSVEAMPPDARELYEEALVKAAAKARETGMNLPAPAGPAGEGAISARTVAVIGILLLIFALIKYFGTK